MALGALEDAKITSDAGADLVFYYGEIDRIRYVNDTGKTVIPMTFEDSESADIINLGGEVQRVMIDGRYIKRDSAPTTRAAFYTLLKAHASNFTDEGIPDADTISLETEFGVYSGMIENWDVRVEAGEWKFAYFTITFVQGRGVG